MDEARSLTENLILRALPADEIELVKPALKLVKLDLGDVINRPYQPIPHVYFPVNSMISVVASTRDGELSEAGVVGREGVLGISQVFGSDTTPHENTVQLPGTAFRMATRSIRENFERCPVLRRRLLQFAHAHMVQLSQTALCNRLHQVEQRFARWILMAHDRADSDLLPLTQELLAIMLGVQRSTVSVVAVHYKEQGLIRYSRGRITVLDRNAIEEICCDCYEVVRTEFERMLPL